MHLIIDVFDCDPDKLETFSPPDEWQWQLNPTTRQVWVDRFEPEDFDANALVRELLADLGGSAAEYQVIDRGPRIREPRGYVPWFTITPPAPEA